MAEYAQLYSLTPNLTIVSLTDNTTVEKLTEEKKVAP